MRWSFIALAALCFVGPVRADEARVIKVLPQLLDKKGRHTLSPSLYERDAYQFHLRKTPGLRAGIRLAVQWKAKKVDWSKLMLRAEMRCLVGDTLHTVTMEEPAVKNGHYSSWTEFRVEGLDYKAFGDLVGWRVGLWEGDHELNHLESFLWSPVATPETANTSSPK